MTTPEGDRWTMDESFMSPSPGVGPPNGWFVSGVLDKMAGNPNCNSILCTLTAGVVCADLTP